MQFIPEQHYLRWEYNYSVVYQRLLSGFAQVDNSGTESQKLDQLFSLINKSISEFVLG